MRKLYAVALTLLLFVPAFAQDLPVTRHGVHLRLRAYPQSSAKEALASVIAALEEGQFEYLLAQLTDPEFVDNRVKQVYGGRFEDLVAEARRKLADNPATINDLRRLLRDGEWQEAATSASVRLKDLADRQVYMKKVGDRWYFENRQRAEK
jgi:hypothetical protein